jgi:hypothetical protein
MIDRDIAYEAMNLVMGDRADSYDASGEPSVRIAGRLWSAYLGVPITDSDVCHMMALLKIGRTKGGYKRDSYVDAVGYELLAESLHRSNDGTH